MIEIELRWDPNDPLAKLWYSPHPSRDEKLWAFLYGWDEDERVFKKGKQETLEGFR